MSFFIQNLNIKNFSENKFVANKITEINLIA